MRFENLNLKRFGHFTDFSLDFGAQTPGEPDLHVLFGPNEAGKSTTLAAITDLLYGIKRKTDWNFLHANDVLELQATLEQGEQRIELTRFKNHWANATKNRLDRFPLDLQGLTREDYARRFSFDELTLQAGGDQILNSDGDVGQALFSASAGLANLKEQMDAALGQANTFWIPGKRVNLQITDLKKALQDNKKQMDAVKLDTTLWKKRCNTLDTASLRRDKHRQTLNKLQQSVRQLEKRQSAQSLAASYRQLTAQRTALESESVVSLEHARAADFLTGSAARQVLDSTRDMLKQYDVAQASRSSLESQQQQLLEQLSACTPDDKMLKLVQASNRIQTLSDETAAVYEWQQQHAECQSVISQCEKDLESARERLALSPGVALESLVPGQSLTTQLQALLDEEQSLASALKHAQSELDALDPLPDSNEPTNTTSNTHTADIDVAHDLLSTIQRAGLSNQLAKAQESLLESEHAHQLKIDNAGLSSQQLNKLTLPDAIWLNSKLSEITQWNQKIEQVHERLKTLASEILEKQNRGAQLTQEGAIDPTSLTDARHFRDAAWLTHSQALEAEQPHPDLQASALQFEHLMNKDDVLQLKAANSNQATTELQLLQTQILPLQNEHQALSETQLPELETSCQHSIEQLKSGIAPFYSEHTIDDELLRQRHTEMLQLTADLAAIQSQQLTVEKLRLNTVEQSRKLLTVLEPVQTQAQLDALGRLDLEDLLTQASKVLENLKTETAQQQESERQAKELTNTHAKRHQLKETAKQAHASWQERWASEASDTLFAELPLSKARDSLAWVATLPELITKHHDASQQLNALSARLDTRAKAIIQLQEELGEESLTDATQSLIVATKQVQQHEDLEKQLTLLRNNLDKNSTTNLANLQSVKTLREQLGADSDQSLMALLVRTEEHRGLNDRCTETLTQLHEISGTDISDEDITRLGEDDSTETVEQQLLDLNSQLQETNTLFDQASEAWTLAKRELEETGDESEYSRLSQEKQNLLLQTMDLAKQCAVARTGQKVLIAAMTRFRQAHQSVILTEAQTAFTTLTGGRYVQLLPRDDGQGNERLFVVDREQKSRAVTELSTGTRYQLYLALRAAAHADYATQRTPLPFVADDIMESFDDERSAAAFTVLARMAEKGQVIYLTHHQHLLDLAKEAVGEDRVRVHHF